MKFTFLISVISLAGLAAAQNAAPSNAGRDIIHAALMKMATGGDLASVNGWDARAQTASGGAPSGLTSFRSSCAPGSGAVPVRHVESNTNSIPEFAPHNAPSVLARLAEPGAADIKRRGLVVEDGVSYNSVEIRPVAKGPADEANAPLQIWLFDVQTDLPRRVTFVSAVGNSVLSLDDFRESADQSLVPFAGYFHPVSGPDTAFNYQSIELKRTPGCH